MLDEILNEKDSNKFDVEGGLKLIKEPSSNVLSKITYFPNTLSTKYLVEENKSLIYTGGKYVVSQNLEFLCKIVQNLSTLSVNILFIPMKDKFLICTHNPSTSLFSKTTLTNDFFDEMDITCLVERNSGCCISSESANSIFRISREFLEDIKHLVINADSSKDFMDVVLVGPGAVSELVKINQLTYDNSINDYLSLRSSGEFCIISHVEIWESLFKRSPNTLSEIIFYMKRESLIIKLKKQNTGEILNFKIEFNAKNFIRYDTEREFVLSFSYTEFAMACNIITNLTKTFVLEYVLGEVPLKISTYQPNIANFEIFLPCNLVV